MDNYCMGWAAIDGLCTPQLMKLVTNAVLVPPAFLIFYCLTTSKKNLVRFMAHDVQYTCIFLNVVAAVFELIVWHSLYGSQGFLILNSVYQLLGIISLSLIYAGGERTASAMSLMISTIFLISYIVAHIFEIVKLSKLHEDFSTGTLDVRLILSCFRTILYLAMLIVDIVNIVKGESSWSVVADRDTCNKHWTAALPSRLTFAWMRGLLVQGWKKPLELADIGNPPKVDECSPLSAQFDALWEEEAKKAEPSLIMVCLKLFKVTYINSIIMMVVGDAMVFLSPFAVSGLNRYLSRVQSPQDDEDVLKDGDAFYALFTLEDFVTNGYVLCFILFLSASCRSLLSQRYAAFMAFWRAAHIRALLQYKIFSKSLRLASWANKDPDLSQGKILNVMSTDTQQYHFIFYFVNFAVTAPIMITAAVTLLLLNIGWSALIGIFILFGSFPIQVYLTKRMGEFQRQMMFAKDKRLKVMNEMMLGMKSIKMYTWESLFQTMIVNARKEEVKILRKQQLHRAVFIFIANVLPTMMACSIFVVYNFTSPIDPVTGEHTPLSTPLALLTLALLSILKLPFIVIPFAMGSYVAGKACGKRIAKFLQAPEVSELPEPTEDGKESVVSMSGATLSWDVAMDAPVILEDVSLEIPVSKLTVVVGRVGAGKTALINAILGEMHLQSGEIARFVSKDKISYASQNPWILNSTVKENIIFGHSLDEKRYKAVCAATCLDLDLKILPAGDQTEIGERGINLSGGQRQRISVARALYAYSDLVILDDPLSALDAHVGAQLFERGIKKFLKDSSRSVVLITHHLQYLKDADLVVEIDSGRLTYVGDHSQYILESKFYEDFVANLAEKGEEEPDVEETIAADRKQSRTRHSTGDIREKKGALTTKEDREKGSVKLSVYMSWARAAGPGLALSFSALLLAQLGRLATDYWIIVWSEKQVSNWTNETNYIVTYIGLALFASCCILIGNITLVYDGLRASHNLFVAMLQRVMLATPRFFDTTPLGRIINRFSGDITNIDTKLLESINNAYNLSTRVLCVIVMQVVASYYFAIAIVPVFLVYYTVQQIYICTSREIQRLDSITKSPIMALFSESLGGLSTIRAYLKLPSFLQRMEKYIDANTNTFVLVNMSSNWVGFRLDLIGVLITTLSSLVCVIGASSVDSDGNYIISAAQAGLALTFALSLPGELNWMLRNISFMELYMNAVERVNNYSTEVPIESDSGDVDPGAEWPTTGVIQFEDYSAAYDAGLDNVLHSLNITIPAGKRVGICGRTGSGKSSLTIALFRLLSCKSGTIKIDNVDIMGLPLQRLREALTIIPQDPLLFAGSLRYNLDPSKQSSDEDIWNALERVNMKKHIQNAERGIDSLITGSGENFSVGQRQLLCLARAFLRNSKIIIMDEATASIDMETDQSIQEVIRSAFIGRTMLVIAHRISSIADSDLVLVMEKGKVAEFDSPQNLSADKNTLFSALLTENVL